MAKTVKNKKNAASAKKLTKQMNQLLTIFAVTFLWETYLLVTEHYYLRGTGQEMLSAYNALGVLPYVGLGIAAVGVICRKTKRKWGIWVLASGLFVALSSFLCLKVDIAIFSGLLYAVPAFMLVAVVYYLYGREFFFIVTAFGISLLTLCYWRRRYAFEQYRLAGAILMVLALLLLAVLALALWKAYKSKGILTLGTHRLCLLTETPDTLFLFGSFALSCAALLISFIFGSLSFYAIILLGVALFAMAVYYTVTAL